MEIRTRILYDVVENYVTTLCEQSYAPLAFHNLSHIQGVVKHSTHIAKHYTSTENEQAVFFCSSTGSGYRDTMRVSFSRTR